MSLTVSPAHFPFHKDTARITANFFSVVAVFFLFWRCSFVEQCAGHVATVDVFFAINPALAPDWLSIGRPPIKSCVFDRPKTASGCDPNSKIVGTRPKNGSIQNNGPTAVIGAFLFFRVFSATRRFPMTQRGRQPEPAPSKANNNSIRARFSFLTNSPSASVSPPCPNKRNTDPIHV